ncbi:hypothetical protein PIB30_040661 [Stylosanthes scabra]|uniref:Uncharacterized protein n=1 Tax=Stylosanthes scabra TaxID=79078 RepID=A0ABU6YF54_9FABA|nr:hypothetical protein [Stylosanthes scabra]
MPRVKRPTKKSRGASFSIEPPPQDHPLAQWFYNKEDFDLYLSDFAPRKVVPPRYLEPNFFDQHRYPNLLGILVRQNLVNYMKIKDSYYPDLIAIAYTTLDVEFEENDLVFSFKIGKNTYALESSELSAIWRLNYDGEKVESRNASEDFRRNYSKENACIMFNVPIDPRRYRRSFIRLRFPSSLDKVSVANVVLHGRNENMVEPTSPSSSTTSLMVAAKFDAEVQEFLHWMLARWFYGTIPSLRPCSPSSSLSTCPRHSLPTLPLFTTRLA